MIQKAIPLLLFAMFTAAAQAQDSGLAPNAPRDKPFSTNETQMQHALKAMEPYVQKARDTYPAVKRRFLAGLPKGHTFFVTTRIADAEARTEQVVIRVSDIDGNQIAGLIASPIQLFVGFGTGTGIAFQKTI